MIMMSTHDSEACVSETPSPSPLAIGGPVCPRLPPAAAMTATEITANQGAGRRPQLACGASRRSPAGSPGHLQPTQPGSGTARPQFTEL